MRANRDNGNNNHHPSIPLPHEKKKRKPLSRFTFHNSFWHTQACLFIKLCYIYCALCRSGAQRTQIAEHGRRQNAMFNINFNFLRERNSFVMTYEPNLTTTSTKHTSARPRAHTHRGREKQALKLRESWKMCVRWTMCVVMQKCSLHIQSENVTLLVAAACENEAEWIEAGVEVGWGTVVTTVSSIIAYTLPFHVIQMIATSFAINRELFVSMSCKITTRVKKKNKITSNVHTVCSDMVLSSNNQ